MALSAFEKFSADDLDVDAVVAAMTDDCSYEHSSELGVEGVRKGKKEIAEWFQGWKKEFPKRKFVVKNICFKGSCLPSPSNVVMVEWGCVDTYKEGTEYQYDGVTVLEIKNMKAFRASEYISFKGLPKLSTLIKPTGKAKV